MKYKINMTQNGITKYPVHTHRSYEIMLYLEGRGYMHTELGDIPFSPGTVVIVPPNVSHGSVSECGFKNISVEGDFGAYLCFDTVKVLEDNDSSDGKVLAGMIYDNRYESDEYLNALCTAYVCFLVKRLEVENAIHKVIRDIIALISKNAFDSKINLAAILSHSGYSEDYVRACFKEITGKTPNAFLTDIRIKHACYLVDIYKNELSFSDIAEMCGYTDYIYFSKKFKSVTGASPREYRNR